MTQPSTNKPNQDQTKSPSRFPADKPKVDEKQAPTPAESTEKAPEKADK